MVGKSELIRVKQPTPVAMNISDDNKPIETTAQFTIKEVKIGRHKKP